MNLLNGDAFVYAHANVKHIWQTVNKKKEKIKKVGKLIVS